MHINMNLVLFSWLAISCSVVIVIIGTTLHFLFRELSNNLNPVSQNAPLNLVSESKEVASFVDQRYYSHFILEFPDQQVIPNVDVKSTVHENKITNLDSEALSSLAAALDALKNGKIKKAQKLFEHSLALSPLHPDVLNHYGEFIENTQNDIISADHHYVKALIHSPGHTRAVLNHDRISEMVEDLDLLKLKEIDKKRDTVASIPKGDSALRKAKLETYFQHIYHTVGIEGNTMSLAQIRSVVESKMAVVGKSIIEHNEIIGLDAALKYINTTLINRIGRITVEDILGIHKRVLGFVDPIEGGTLRQTQVFVGGHIPPEPSSIPPLMKQFEAWLNSWEAMSLHPVQYAALAHYKLVYLHPFNDGNGRTSRLLMNTILMQAGYPPVIILKQDRHRYYETIELANEGDIRPFIRFIAECTERTLDLFIWSTSKLATKLPALAIEMIREERKHPGYSYFDNTFTRN